MGTRSAHRFRPGQKQPIGCVCTYAVLRLGRTETNAMPVIACGRGVCMTPTSSDLPLTRPPIAKAELMIRKPAAEVFEAFVNPAITSRFWFTQGSGRLEPGRQARWEWEMYGVSATV